MSQAELLGMLHEDPALQYLNQTALSRIENGTRQIRMIEALSISRILGAKVETMTDPHPELSLILDRAENDWLQVRRWRDRTDDALANLHAATLDALKSRSTVAELAASADNTGYADQRKALSERLDVVASGLHMREVSERAARYLEEMQSDGQH